MSEGESSSPIESKRELLDTEIDVSSMFRGTATVALVSMLMGAIGMFGSFVIFVLSRPGGFAESIQSDLAVILLMTGGMITLFFFLFAMGFFVRFNRRMGRVVISSDFASVDMEQRGAKTVIVVYGLAVGFILMIGSWSYYLVYKYLLSDILNQTQAYSFLAFIVSTGIFVIALLILLVLTVLGRTITTVIKTVLAHPE